MSKTSYRTEGGLTIRRETLAADAATLMPDLAKRLDRQRGVLLSSSFEFPGRYTRLDMGFADPPVMLTARGREVTVTALNERGEILLRAIAPALRGMAEVEESEASATRLFARLRQPEGRFPEEQRSRQPSVFSMLRRLGALFRSREDEHLGLYGAFGYDLVFQFEPMTLRLPRAADQRDLVLFLPDEVLVVDHMRGTAERHRYEFTVDGTATEDLPRETPADPYRPGTEQDGEIRSDYGPGEYAAMVERAREAFARGDRDTLRSLLGPETFAGFEGAIKAREDAGETQRTEIRHIHEVTVEGAELRGSVADVTVRFVSDQVNMTLAADGKPVTGTDSVTELKDLWTFQRDLKSGDPTWRLVDTRSV